VNKKAIILVIIGIVALLWFWPNLVHEPIHYATALALGGNAHIVQSWKWPATPVMNYTALSAHAEIIMQFMPSLISLLLLLIIFITPKWNLFTDVSLPIYLVFDLVINIEKRLPTSDWRAYHAIAPVWLDYLISLVILSLLVLMLIKAAKSIYTSSQVSQYGGTGGRRILSESEAKRADRIRLERETGRRNSAESVK